MRLDSCWMNLFWKFVFNVFWSRVTSVLTYANPLWTPISTLKSCYTVHTLSLRIAISIAWSRYAESGTHWHTAVVPPGVAHSKLCGCYCPNRVTSMHWCSSTQTSAGVIAQGGLRPYAAVVKLRPYPSVIPERELHKQSYVHTPMLFRNARLSLWKQFWTHSESRLTCAEPWYLIRAGLVLNPYESVQNRAA